jgi:membrane-associated phospholipid phosphatase
MEKNIARAISYLFHPLLIPSYAVLILMLLPEDRFRALPFQSSLLLLAFIFLSTFVFPALLMLILKNFKVISSLEMEQQKERVLPLALMSMIFYAVFYLLKQGPPNTVFNLFLLGSTLLVLFTLLINYFWKISIHMVAQGGLFGAMLGLALRFGIEIRLILFLIILITGITAFSRLKLKAHAPAEVYGGFLLGAGFMLGLFLVV